MLKEKLKKVDIFTALDDNELELISQMAVVKKLDTGNILFYEGDEADAFYVLLEGELKLYKTGPRSQEIVLHYFTIPSMVGQMATLENINFPATAVAMGDEVKIAVIDKEKFLKLLKSDAKFSFHLVKSLTKRIKDLEVVINRNLIFDATAKVCSLIKENPEILKTKKNIQIASILNMTPETLSRTLKKLKKLQVLDESNNLADEKMLDIFLEF